MIILQWSSSPPRLFRFVSPLSPVVVTFVSQVSGTFNPPHRGHVRLGLFAKERLEKLGHKVQALPPTWKGERLVGCWRKNNPNHPVKNGWGWVVSEVASFLPTKKKGGVMLMLTPKAAPWEGFFCDEWWFNFKVWWRMFLCKSFSQLNSQVIIQEVTIFSTWKDHEEINHPTKKGVRKERAWWLDLWNGWMCLFVKLEALPFSWQQIIQLWGRFGTGKCEFLESSWKVNIFGWTRLPFFWVSGFHSKKMRENEVRGSWKYICQGVGNFITTFVFRKWFLSPFSAGFSLANLGFCNLNPMGFLSF